MRANKLHTVIPAETM